MASSTSAHSQAEELQRQMREVRKELRDDVTDLVQSAHKMSDWTSYVRAYPWLCVGAAAAAGFFLVPTRPLIVHPDPDALFKLAKEHDLVMKPEDEKRGKKKGGLVAQLVSMAAAAALQGGLKVASQQITQAMSSTGKAGSNGRAGVPHA
jgi:hypothetical protein